MNSVIYKTRVIDQFIHLNKTDLPQTTPSVGNDIEQQHEGYDEVDHMPKAEAVDKVVSFEDSTDC